MQQNEEIEIDLIDLIKQLIRRWYLIFGGILIGAVIALGVGKLKTIEGAPDPALTDEQLRENALADAAADLTDTQIERIEFLQEEQEQLQLTFRELNETMMADDDPDAEVSNIRSDRIIGVSNALESVATQISGFNAKEKAYYDVLNGSVVSQTTAAGNSSKKAVILGAAAGGFLVCMVLALIYIFSTDIKTASEVSTMYDRPVLMECRRNTAKLEEAQLRMLAEDIAILMERGEKTKLFLPADCEEEGGVSAQIFGYMTENNKSITVSSASALDDPEGLRRLSEAEVAIPVIHVKHTKRGTLNQLIQYCRRYGIDVPGFVTYGA